ncbi:hypothetical protein CTAYLR_008420 [Chrysophaeum taylorii]|uniref:Mannose-P-dolichol utilization defect 1 protein homolog n=1 Tax=Chrysophaeum taylorii TaxID=2483200 RepID=A0AAD7XPN9_9STRA|nr:hypothetical protein CTAYLR_008420 [Chrysophaeum taylorii]
MLGGVVRRLEYYAPCALFVLSKVLGYLVIAGSLGFKLPQIAGMWRHRSAEGLSLVSCELDVLVFVASLGYSLRRRLPISEFGEQASVLVQNLVILSFVWRFAEATTRARMCGAVAAALAACMAISFIPRHLVLVLPAFATVASLASRVPQIVANATQRHTGQLAVSTCGLNVAGALARVLTTLGGSRDLVMLASYALSFLLNGTIFIQILWYRKNTNLALQNKLKHS